MQSQIIPNSIKSTLESLVTDLKIHFGKDLSGVILYGSYARGENHKYSDVDLLVLIHHPDVKQFDDFITDLTARYLLNNSVLFSILVYSVSEFNYWKDTMDLFVNIEEDGIPIL